MKEYPAGGGGVGWDMPATAASRNPFICLGSSDGCFAGLHARGVIIVLAEKRGREAGKSNPFSSLASEIIATAVLGPDSKRHW